ncbi:MAG TPA: type II toxin-antitoxin system VapC family toxin, partial [Vicinamibacterales bacterium]|nr:type II toxin-antitoxin system VapC family toxin [Vicinamibacterales bacterium]
LWWAEVVNALLVGERRKLIFPAQSADYVARLPRLPIAIDSASAAVRKDAVLELGRRHALTAYDATYLELALRLHLALATFDRALAKAATAAGVEIV